MADAGDVSGRARPRRWRWVRPIAIGLAVAVGAAVAVVLYPPVYWASATTAVVVDEETRAPIEGVLVDGFWTLRWVEGIPVRDVAVFETTTDAEGRFTLPAWGPRVRWPPYAFLLNDPQLFFFKVGYLPKAVSNYHYKTIPWFGRDPHRVSEWNGKAISLRPMNLSRSDYVAVVIQLQIRLSRSLESENCVWESILGTLGAVYCEGKRLREAGLPRAGELWSSDDLARGFGLARHLGCGSISEAMRRHLPCAE